MLSKLPMEFMGFAMNLVAASTDGNLSIDEIKECVGDSFEGGEKVIEAVEEALEDGSISVMEVINIASTVISTL